MGEEAENNQQQPDTQITLPTTAPNPNPNSITKAQFAAWKLRKDADSAARKAEAERKREEDIAAGLVQMNGLKAVLLLWYKDGVFAIENRSPAEGAYSEGLLNAKLTQQNMYLLLLIVIDFLGFPPSVIATAAVITAAGDGVDLPDTFDARISRFAAACASCDSQPENPASVSGSEPEYKRQRSSTPDVQES
ncbi:hypothetical protein PHJA_001476600 [Phtheirospermum japonicum]|uniref:Uncharacterized protein n=1 Tax=Phtheirospermum japonicum TaxID=374723 RepID=A0A830C560_9LAMI|nr:hypothetical protein PHJA_001476600 [Phtheirospermum japonicum]